MYNNYIKEEAELIFANSLNLSRKDVVVMSNNTTSSIITIGRKYGSAGRQIGQEVAKYFGIKCYDKELLEHAANDSGICKELFEHHDEKPTNSFLLFSCNGYLFIWVFLSRIYRHAYEP